MAGQATGSCQGQQGTGSGSNTLDPWGDYLPRQQFVQQTLNQVGGPRIPSTPTNGSRGGSSSPNPHQGGFWNQGLVTQFSTVAGCWFATDASGTWKQHG